MIFASLYLDQLTPEKQDRNAAGYACKILRIN